MNTNRQNNSANSVRQFPSLVSSWPAGVVVREYNGGISDTRPPNETSRTIKPRSEPAAGGT